MLEPSVDVIFATVVVATALVLMVKLADCEPGVTDTVDGTTALVVLDVSLIVTAFEPTAVASVTTPEAEVPPTALVGVMIKLEISRGLTSRGVDWLTPPNVALITAERGVVTTKGVTAKVALLLPAGILTDAGTVAALVLELLRVTVAPPEDATPSIVTVAVTEPCDPPTTSDGEIVML